MFVTCQESEDGKYVFNNIYLHGGKTMFKFAVSISQADIIRYEIKLKNACVKSQCCKENEMSHERLDPVAELWMRTTCIYCPVFSSKSP